MRRRRPPRDLTALLRDAAGRRLWQWLLLDQAERAALERTAGRLLDKRWEASHGFAIDDEMRATVAVHAALLHLGHDEVPFGNVTAVVIHSTTMTLRGERPGPLPGVVTNAPLPTHGHTTARGPVFLAWDVIARELAAPRRTTNVILHEFAHKIDALNGTFDGTPRLAGAAQLEEWIGVCTAELEALRRGTPSAVLRPYAATNPSEFFAVATESFFEQPLALRAEKSRLYGVLAAYYRQDPAAREVGGAGPVADTGATAGLTQWITPSG
jgi:hypothetical protein